MKDPAERKTTAHKFTLVAPCSNKTRSPYEFQFNYVVVVKLVKGS